MRLLICAGGTGGGVYPALAVLRALENELQTGSPLADQVLWLGGSGGMEAELVKRAGVAFEAIPAAGVHGVGLRLLPGNLIRLGQGFLQARQILKRFQPEVMFLTGGYVAVPAALAGRRIPTLLFVPDIEPGIALKFLARFADRIAVCVAESKRFFSKTASLVVTGYPVRPELQGWTKVQARQTLGLAADLPVLLVFGGSSGARSINRALLPVLPELLSEMQVLHISGALDWGDIQAEQTRLALSLPSELMGRYHPFPYLHDEMGAALAAADLALSRAGASALGEFPFFGLPAILVPYPYAWRYQKINAEYLAQHEAAVILPDEELSTYLISLVRNLIHDHVRLERMQAAMRTLAHPQAASSIAASLLDLAQAKSAGGLSS